METYHSKQPVKAIAEQVNSNTISWIGNQPGETGARISGQTFFCPTEGELDCIEILPAHISRNSIVSISIHHFDPVLKQWGPVLGSSQLELKRNDTGNWIAFPIPGLHLEEGMVYGFRLKSEQSLVGVAEAARSVNSHTYRGGQEWTAHSDDQPGKYYSYLSLAFKVEMRA